MLFKQEPMEERRVFSVVLEPDPEGGYTAIVPALPGVVTEGETVSESLENARDAIRLCIDDLREQGLAVPQSDTAALFERVEISIAS
ncbi:MAG: type II toxin-antitoxin system HicB family antitoxin [Candidatus Tumulicola sp.]